MCQPCNFPATIFYTKRTVVC